MRASTQNSAVKISALQLVPQWRLVIVANLLFLLFAIAIVRLAWLLDSQPTTYLVCLLGALLGWGLGILATPLTRSDGQRFVTLGQAISAFVSGYLVSKFDRFLENALFSVNASSSVTWQRVALFSASLLAMAIVVFLNRTYLHEPLVPAQEANRVEPLNEQG